MTLQVFPVEPVRMWWMTQFPTLVHAPYILRISCALDWAGRARHEGRQKERVCFRRAPAARRHGKKWLRGTRGRRGVSGLRDDLQGENVDVRHFPSRVPTYHVVMYSRCTVCDCSPMMEAELPHAGDDDENDVSSRRGMFEPEYWDASVLRSFICGHPRYACGA